ncbi:hypothetical protein PPSIR1_37364 [Plesiocystis pacifica SIR-1]|uniref:Lipoprotein n=1 Tax=Plesiocystis pacifica SIR-1 TaxID=391625 RepID=A6G0N8_9BACT|nr:hypothetical protein PPSIR1_37364 [Plesiocystis pacifica SIR-1]
MDRTVPTPPAWRPLRVALVTCSVAAALACADDLVEPQGGPVAMSVEECEAPTRYAACGPADASSSEAPGVEQASRALGLGCEPGPDESSLPEVGGAGLLAVDPDSWRVAERFGSWWTPRATSEGHNLDARLLLLSTGRLPALDVDAAVVAAPGSALDQGETHNPDGGPLFAPLTSEPGCDGALDCSGSLAEPFAHGAEPHDALALSTALEVPPGTHGLRLDLAYFSAEYPEFTPSAFNDVLAVWSTSEAFTGNVALVEGRALTASSLSAAGWMRHRGDDPALAGTGFEGHGGSGWLELRVPVVPGERVELTIYLADVGDDSVASAVLLDDLRWDCEPCSFDGEGPACGLAPRPNA